MRSKSLVEKIKLLLGRKDFLQIIFNINWLVFERILRLTLGIFVGAWVARYLGPGKYGVMNYAIAFGALFSAFSTLGLDNVVIRNLITTPNDKFHILGAGFILKFLGAMLQLILSYLFIIIIRPNDYEIKLFVLIISTSYMVKSFDIIDYWYQSKVKSKYAVVSRVISLVFISGLKIVLIKVSAPLIYFIITIVIESVIITMGLIMFYSFIHRNSIFCWNINRTYIKLLLKDSWPLALSNILVVISLKIGQIMIGEYLGTTQVGIYSAASRLTELLFFIPMIISGSLFPSILESRRRKDFNSYSLKMQRLYDFSTWFAILLSFIIFVLSKPIISFLYGSEYIESGKVLGGIVWAFVFVSWGVCGSRYLIAENLTKIALFRNLLGVATLIILNIILIPRFDVFGAVLSFNISQFVSSFIANSLFVESSTISKGIISTFNFSRIINYYKKIKK